jgi:hypothetical protein
MPDPVTRAECPHPVMTMNTTVSELLLVALLLGVVVLSGKV